MEGESHNYLHFRLPLVPGKNKFTIVPGNQLFELNYQQVKGAINRKTFGKETYLFHLEDKLPDSCVDCHDLQESADIDPMGLMKGQASCATCHKNYINKSKWKHSTTVNHQCLICHQLSVKPWRIGIPVGKIDDTCFICHNGKKEQRTSKYRHGPMIAGCTLCHNPHGDEHRYYLWADSALDICVTCHSDKQKLLEKNRSVSYVHGVIRGGGCVLCHDPHASNERFMLRKSINKLCMGCHEEQVDLINGHPVARHPVAAPKERRRPDRELTCVGCHDPHASAHQYLLVETKLGGLLCRGCHKR
jgi:predicted CXXCH cytochrome family protein